MTYWNSGKYGTLGKIFFGGREAQHAIRILFATRYPDEMRKRAKIVDELKSHVQSIK